jgi:hypothetical protein
MEVSNYMYDEYNERGMKAFEIRIKKILRDNDINVNEFICHNAWMERGSGYGSYYRCIEYSIDGDMTTLSSHTNDSMAWDDFGQTNKERRQLFEAVLIDNIYKL